ncbi:MAG: hypothetical protein ACYDCK_11735 [Thermoplasmatota archaeon]
MDPREPRAAGIVAFAATALLVAGLVLELVGLASGPPLRAAGLLLFAVVAAHLARRSAWRDPPLAIGATACGIASCFLWAGAGVFVPWSWEPVWLALSAVWWLGIGRVLRGESSRLGNATMVVGAAAALDVVATLFDARLPSAASLLLGLWKLPLSILWGVGLGLHLTRFEGDPFK